MIGGLVPALLRAWLVGHRASTAALALVVVTCGTAAFADLQLDSILSTSPFPLWGMFPPTLAVAIGAAAENRLPVPHPRSPPPVRARLGWGMVLGSAAAGAAWVVAVTAAYPALLLESLVLVGFTLGTSCLVGRWCVVLGLAMDAAVATRGADSAFVGLDYWYDHVPAGLRVLLVALAAAGWVAYVAIGPRRSSGAAPADG